MKKILNIYLLILFIASSAFAEVTTTVTTVHGTGYGHTRKEAVQEAVLQVIQQRHGVKIESANLATIESVNQSVISNGQEENLTAFNDAFVKQVREVTKGSVSNYKIIDQGQDLNGQYWAKVEVLFSTSEYKTPGLSADSRRKMSVYPFEVTQAEYRFGNQPVYGPELSRRFTQGLVSGITQSRKFAVLDRENFDAYAREKGLLLSGNSPWQEKLKLGKLLGSDYLVIGTIDRVELKTTKSTVQITGETRSQTDAIMEISYRILAMATNQVKWSDTTTVKISEKRDITLNELIDTATNQITLDLVENIYPPQIIHVDGQRVALNLGAKSYNVGDELTVFQQGKRLVDPYTKEFMGYSESEVGLIRVTETTPKVTYATIASSTAPIKEGMLCRRVAASATQDQGVSDEVRRATNATITEGGGVRLPFD